MPVGWKRQALRTTGLCALIKMILMTSAHLSSAGKRSIQISMKRIRKNKMGKNGKFAHCVQSVTVCYKSWKNKQDNIKMAVSEDLCVLFYIYNNDFVFLLIFLQI